MNIFFDLDGPILDVSERHWRVYRDFCTANNLRCFSKRAYWDKKRRQVRVSIPGSRRDSFDKFWSANIESPAYIRFDAVGPRVKRALAEMRRDNVLYLITLRRNPRSLMAELRKLNLTGYFKRIFHVSPEGGVKWKVKAAKISRLAKPGDAMIGDTVTDIKCGRALKITTIAVLSGMRNSRILRAANPDFLAKDIGSAAGILKKHTNYGKNKKDSKKPRSHMVHN